MKVIIAVKVDRLAAPNLKLDATVTPSTTW